MEVILQMAADAVLRGLFELNELPCTLMTACAIYVEVFACQSEFSGLVIKLRAIRIDPIMAIQAPGIEFNEV